MQQDFPCTHHQGSVIGISTHSSENSTQTIQCPIRLSGGARPVIIRIEKTETEKVAVGLPIFNSKPDVTFTYFSVYLNSTLLVDSGGEGDDGSETVLAAALAVAFVAAAILTCAVCFLWAKQRRGKWKGAFGNKSNFYADINMQEKTGVDDASSVVTESTTAYERYVNLKKRDSTYILILDVMLHQHDSTSKNNMMFRLSL